MFTIKSKAAVVSVASNSSLILLKVAAGLLIGCVTGFLLIGEFPSLTSLHCNGIVR